MVVVSVISRTHQVFEQELIIHQPMLYLRFCSTIYHFYARKDSDPAVYTFWASTAIVTANFIGIYDIMSYFIYPTLPFSKTIALIFLSIVGLLNYLIVFLPAKYKEVKPKPNSGRNTIIYIIVSVALLIGMTKLHHDRNVEAIQNQQLEIEQ